MPLDHFLVCRVVLNWVWARETELRWVSISESSKRHIREGTVSQSAAIEVGENSIWGKMQATEVGANSMT